MSLLLIKSLIFGNPTARDPANIAPSLLAEAIEVVQDVRPQLQKSLQRYENYAQQISTASTASHTYTDCQCRPRTRRSNKRSKWLWTVSEETYNHQPNCSRFAHADYYRSIAAQFTVYTRFLGLCVQAGWQSSRKGGWNTIAPVLRYRAVVSRDSPAFKLLDDVRDTVCSMRRSKLTDSYLTDLLLTTSSSLQRCFGTEARPTDLDEHGNGILCVSVLSRITFRPPNYSRPPWI